MFASIIKTFGQTQNQKITIKDILYGCTVGHIQSVGIMQVIPLISDLEDDRFVSPEKSKIYTQGYGNLVFENKSDKLLLVPCHVGYVVKQAAQDHAMSHAGIVKSNEEKIFDTAMCIQQTQGGYISKDKHKLIILPYSLRENALSIRNEKNYSKLWNDISKLNEKYGLQPLGNLVAFMKNFEKQLNEFVAEFECVPQQIGAIILIGGEVVGIERTPSVEYWYSVWESLIGECYGSYAIEMSQKYKGKKIPETRIPLNIENINTVEDLERELSKAKKYEEELSKTKVRELLDIPFTLKTDERVKTFKLKTIKNNQFIGQIVCENKRVLYASLITSGKWNRKNI